MVAKLLRCFTCPHDGCHCLIFANVEGERVRCPGCGEWVEASDLKDWED